MDNNNKTDDEIQDIPWQVSWKQPQWNSYTSHNQQDENISNNIESSSSSSSFVVGSVSAQIDPTELPSSYFKQSTQDDAESSSSPSSSSVILLTATLVQRKSKHRHRHRRRHKQQHYNVASQLILELHRLPATKPQNNNDQHHRRVLLESRTFQWPEAVFMSNNSSSSDDDDDDDIQEEEEEKEPKDEQDDLMTCNIPQGNAIRSILQTFFPRRKQLQVDPDTGNNPKKKKTKKKKPKKSPPQNGLVSAVFVRRNPSTTAQNNASSTDAMDTIALLSLGMMDYHSPRTTTFQQQQQEEEKLEPTPHPQKKDDAASTTSSTGATSKKNLPELYLACMTVQGLIAIYSPWTLLNIHSTTSSSSGTEKSQSPAADNSSSNVGNTPEQEFVDGLATLFLGHEVFSTLEQAYKPLSQPISTISLSLLEQNQVYQHNSNAASTTSTSSISSRNNTTRRGRRRPRALDVSLWNHLLESATLPHRTVANRVTQLAVAGTGHLIVLGTGIPYSQVFEDDDSSIFSKEEEKAVGRGNASKQRKKQHQQEWDANSIATDHEDDHVDENTTISEDQVAGGGDTSHAHSQDDTHKWYSQDYQQEEVENEAKSEDGRKPPAADNDEEDDDDDDDDDSPVHLSTGGFVTFCSISQWSETRTLFTPFAPKHVSYIPQWNSMELLLVLGETQAMAIRMDSSNHPVVIGTSATSTPPNADTMLNTAIRSESTTEDMEGSSPPTTNNATNNSNNTMWIKRFQVLPIPFPQTSIKGRILCGSAMGVQPPALLQLFTEDEDALVLQKTLKGITSLGTIEMSHAPGHVAKMRAQEKESLDKTWSLLGQGWSILGTNQRVYFICWEGATAARGVAYVTELDASPNFGPKGAKVDFVLPLFPSTPVLARKNLKLPFSDPVETSKLAEVAAAGSESKDEQDDGDGFVMGALESISAMNYGAGEDGLVSPSPRSSTAALTHREKSIRLLGQCSPWTQLEDDSDTMNQQVPVLSARFEKLTNPYYTLTMRQMVVENGPASPFQQVLSWLVENEDYFTAAGIALDLLKDGETLFHLWKHADKIDEVDEQSKLDGLLDGIIPIGEEDYSDESKAATDAVESLADMTVACLTKGGFPMSTTLQRFLRHNKHYDASRACLMLAAIAANALSEGPESVSVTRENASIDDLLWPVRCLLEVGVTRDCLPTALLLLNSTIPDELRRRPIQYSESVGVPDMELTEKLVTSIVACDKGATDLLLDLVDDATRGSYWQSLDHSTSLVLSLIMVETKYPLLRHIEVRSWAQEQLHTCLKNKKMAVANEEDNLPTDWLKRLCVACLQNAGYDLERFEIPIAEPFVAVEEIPNAVPAEPFVAAEDGLKKYMAEISGVRSAFVSSPGPGGIDFDLLIPCLLLLESREVHWNNGNYAATQSILDATCFLAGHPTKAEPAFMFDGASAMRQCALAGNIRAGASLVGGKNGFVLHCCDVLISALGMKMDDAEAFFLDDSVSMGVLESVSSSSPFEVGDEHRHLLWLLDEHVLSVKTFGEFDTRHIRGKVDPVFCARSILRAWLFLTYGDKRNGVDWLVAYLKDRLDMNDTTRPSPHRLPCAALSRALFWTTAGGTTTLLCAQLDMDLAFLVQLALSCCGLVESVPRAVAEEIRRQPEAPSTAALTGSLIPS
eukprot:scaffold3670_cov124-Cylindrotheca_fusiformis.AAC.1